MKRRSRPSDRSRAAGERDPFLIAIGTGNVILRLPTVARMPLDPSRIGRLQMWLADGAVVMNIVVIVASWTLWKVGIIRLR